MNKFECVLKNGQKITGKYVGCRIADSEIPKHHYRYSVSWAESKDKPALIEEYAKTNHMYDIVTKALIVLKAVPPNVPFAEIETFTIM